MTTPTIIQRHSGPSSALLPLLPSFADLSAGTEFGHYGESQWSFLLSGNEISAFVAQNYYEQAQNEAEKVEDAVRVVGEKRKAAEEARDDVGKPKLGGCVLRVKLDESTCGLGMVLVDPSQRGRGLARRLIEAAMAKGGGSSNDSSDGKDAQRFVLAVCSELGQPIYRNLGFKNAGMVYGLSCSLSDVRDAFDRMEDDKYWNPISTGWINGGGGKVCSQRGRGVLFALDRKATGYDRRERIDLLLDGSYAPDAASTVVFGYDTRVDGWEGRTMQDCVAVARQDCIGGPVIVGPIIGPPEAALPLIWRLSHQHKVKGNDDDVQMSIMMSDHPEVVERLLRVDGMTKTFENPAMSTDGGPIYRNGDGSYLALMHPTLG